MATIGSTGHPHVVAMWYGFLDGQVAFWTFAKSQKILNLRRNPNVSAPAEEGTTYDRLKGVELVGKGASSRTSTTSCAIGLSVAERHTGPAALADEARPFIDAEAPKRRAS